MRRSSARTCAECGGERTRTVLIGVAGFLLAKDLCSKHLSDLLDGARDS